MLKPIQLSQDANLNGDEDPQGKLRGLLARTSQTKRKDQNKSENSKNDNFEL